MRKTWGKLGGAIVGPFLRACLLFLMFSPALCRAQICPMATITSITPDTWYTGVTNTSILTGNNLALTNQTNGCQLSNNLTVGPIDGNGFGNEVPFTTFQIGIIPNQDFNTTQQLVIVIPDSVPTETATYTVYGYCDGYVGMDCPKDTYTILWSTSFPVQIINIPTINLERIDLMDVKATGTPNVTGTSENSAFNYYTVNVAGSSVATIGYASGSNAQSNPTFFQLTEPDNPCTGGVPCQGGLESITAKYTVNGVSSADKSFSVPTFGMSCYYTTLESDWGAPPNNCTVPLKWKGVRYTGAVTNPSGLNGTYCLAFIEDVLLNTGSGVLNNGQDIQQNNGNIVRVSTIKSADGSPVVAGQTVARDRSIIPGIGVLIDLDQVGTGILANDIGSDIIGYRLDLYQGAGKGVCANNNNIMAVGACTPATSGCPASAIQ